MAEQKQISMRVMDGVEFFAHEVTIQFNPAQFTIDFKSITPRTDPRSKSQSFVMRHNVVMLDPWTAKATHEIMGTVIERYEKEFGKIKKPKAVEKAEKMQKKALGKVPKKKDTHQPPTYLG